MAVSWGPDGARPVRLVPLPSECTPDVAIASTYFEVVYGPLVGPTSVALARNLARRTSAATGPVQVDLIEVALEIGVRASRLEPLGRSSPIIRAFDRLHHHRLLAVLGGDVVGVYVTVPPLADVFVSRLPAAAQQFHGAFMIAGRLDPDESGGAPYCSELVAGPKSISDPLS